MKSTLHDYDCSGGRIAPSRLREQFASFVADASFPCLGAKAALNSGSYVLSIYEELASPVASQQLARDLAGFARSKICRTNEYASYVAIFERPRLTSEENFESLLWSQLQQVSALDLMRYDWDPAVSSDPRDPVFSFSVGATAFYVIGMHGKSSRKARRFPWPALIFNPHHQFERLRADGRWTRMRDSIRARDVSLQGDANPMLSDFGERSEARQYSGRAVPDDWKPPFQADATKPDRCPFHRGK
jgi:FPC/CPF motif-containing protein YcgG